MVGNESIDVMDISYSYKHVWPGAYRKQLKSDQVGTGSLIPRPNDITILIVTSYGSGDEIKEPYHSSYGVTVSSPSPRSQRISCNVPVLAQDVRNRAR